MTAAAKFGIVREPDDLARLRKAARELPTDQLPDFIGELESIKAIAWSRLTAPASNPQPHDELVDVAAAAERLGVSQTFLYHHAQDYPFTRRQGRKLLFSALGIDKYIRDTKKA
jgi:hypothetical protein